MNLSGIHHLTAISADISGNHRFYTETLGMRLVKRSVNQDDVSSYHLFYADAKGNPGARSPADRRQHEADRVTNHPHANQPVLTMGPASAEARLVVIGLHGRGASAEDILTLAAELAVPDNGYLAPEAADRTWYLFSSSTGGPGGSSSAGCRSKGSGAGECRPVASSPPIAILGGRRVSCRIDRRWPATTRCQEALVSRAFVTTGAAGLDTDSFPWQLWQKAKRLGTWDPAAIDLTRDRADWTRLAPQERDVLLRLSTLFQAGEEAVTVDLLPLIQVIARQGRLEEEIYLTSFLFEEAKHVELFRRFFDEVAAERTDLSRYFTPSYRTIFFDALPTALNRLRHDDSDESMAMASVTYNLIVEGVLAETGYRAYHAALARNGILPGMQEGVQLTKRDESRHIACGVFLLARLVHQGGAPLWDRMQERMGQLMEPAVAIIPEVFACYDPMPLGLQLAEFTDYAVRQFQARLGRIARAVEGDLAGATEGLGD